MFVIEGVLMPDFNMDRFNIEYIIAVTCKSLYRSSNHIVELFFVIQCTGKKYT